MRNELLIDRCSATSADVFSALIEALTKHSADKQKTLCVFCFLFFMQLVSLQTPAFAGKQCALPRVYTL